MKLARTFRSLPAILFCLVACESMASTETMPDIGKMLQGITDAPSAEAQQQPLTDAVAKLKQALGGLGGDAGANEGQPAASGGMVQSVLAKFGIGPETMGMIDGLMQNEAVQKVLGGVLEQLKGMLPAMG